MADLELQDRTLHLDRYPLRRNEPLKPWDAADEYLLEHCRTKGLARPADAVLIVNDQFGALAAALHDIEPTTWSDSFLSRLALAHNLERNHLPAAAVTFVEGDRNPEGSFDLVLLKVPKSLAHLEDTLLRLRSRLRPGALVVAGSMIKHTPARVYHLLEKIIGPTRTSLGWKKSRLATAVFDEDRNLPDGLTESIFQVEEFGWDLISGPNVFSRDHLDQGTRLLLKHLPFGDHLEKAADLGCGNGVLALAVAARCPAAKILGVDESYQSVASARANLERTGLEGREILFKVDDGLESTPPASLQAVVCNPPFHQAQAVGDLLAWRMFEQARRALAAGGDLRVVGNRHLGYHVKLKKLFGNCEILGTNAKFVVLQAVR